MSRSLVGESRCQVCRAWLDEEDLFCHNCGTESSFAPTANTVLIAHDRTPQAVAFHCNGCGASMNYDASAQKLRCPFCGNQALSRKDEHRILRADWVVPFQIDRPAAEHRLRSFLGSSFWHPNDLRASAAVQSITPLYIPYWAFSVDVETNYTVDSSSTPFGARGDWMPLSGQHRGSYQSILIPASYVLQVNEMSAVEPFDLSHAVLPDQVDLVAITYEEFQLQRREARRHARVAIEHLERQAVSTEVSGRLRNLQINSLMSGIVGRPVLMPIWILAYNYRGKVHRVLINGQSGRTSGSAPLSYLKVVLLVGSLFFVLSIVAILANAS